MLVVFSCMLFSLRSEDKMQIVWKLALAKHSNLMEYCLACHMMWKVVYQVTDLVFSWHGRRNKANVIVRVILYYTSHYSSVGVQALSAAIVIAFSLRNCTILALSIPRMIECYLAICQIRIVILITKDIQNDVQKNNNSKKTNKRQSHQQDISLHLLVRVLAQAVL